MGLWDKIKQTGSDFMKDGEILNKIHAGKELTDEEIAFYNEKHPDISIEDEKIKYDKEQDEKRRLRQHNKYNLEKLNFFSDEDGFYYFSKNKTLTGERYYLTQFEWNGSTYESETTTTTIGKDNTQGRSGSTIIGGLVGTAIAPGVGTFIGGLAGSSRKKKTDINRKSVTKTTQQEKPTQAFLIFIEKDSKNREVKKFMCDSKIVEKVLKLNFTPESYAFAIDNQMIGNSEEEVSLPQTPVEELKQLKELLDLEIITQEEFDQKKKELLNLY